MPLPISIFGGGFSKCFMGIFSAFLVANSCFSRYREAQYNIKELTLILCSDNHHLFQSPPKAEKEDGDCFFVSKIRERSSIQILHI